MDNLERLIATGLPFSIVNRRDVVTAKSKQRVGEVAQIRKFAGWSGGGAEYVFRPNELGKSYGYKKMFGDTVRKALDRGAKK